ncbi:DUF4354 family protein [Erwinia sp. S38]|uniref:DUF4354 family protein n=1 Tax=Erwinia sp. S38 TaxID=2769338 RepID=UPI00190D4CC5|nr:DUF4354 family protein [Erwinia sp. S38]MBK0001049.1 DUF4354 family protein [Erwinia sp. S38]
MQRNSLIAILIATAGLYFSSAAFADSVPKGLTVYATEKEQTSRSEGDLNNYGKTFEVTLENLTSNSVDLNNICLRGYSHEGKEFPVARVQEALTKGKLKPQKKVTGLVVFSAADDSVFDVNQLKIAHNCG